MTERDIFIAALQIDDPDQRRAYLDEACSQQPDVRRNVEELLQLYQGAGSFLLNPAATGAFLDNGDHATSTGSPGMIIGPYKLVEQIGEGGMGTVWMAQQTEPIKRLVALKLIKAGMDSKQVIARFEAERQALALMDHANIARVLEAGTTSIGRPYFVMDLVKGMPITRYCDEQHLTPRQRLELFIPVCQAVQHAHQKGIIHRDLKPSNVLVALYDGKPVPKVIDFGVAKATGQSLTEQTLVTGFGALVGTLEYMSPEQAEINQLDVDTRSDIYSLGVLLYELLAGSPPFSRKDLERAGMLEMLRVIREQEPTKPSTKLSNAEGLPTLAANRGTEPKRLTKLMRGELDWIVMKSLEKDRSRRYETANGFAMDVQRYLAGEAVQAVPPSAAYRLRKFGRKNRTALATAAALGLLMLGAAGLAWRADRQAAGRERAERSRQDRNAEAVAALLDQCEADLRADRTDRASIALEAAERRAADGGADNLAARLAGCRSDLTLLRELNAIDTIRWTWAQNRQHPGALSARWRTALAAYGVTPDEDPPAEAAVRLNGSLVRDRALTALDLWLATADSSAWARAVLRSADPDPYREDVRSALAARDGRKLTDLADRPDALAQPVRFAAVLGLLNSVPADRQRAILEAALPARPGDLALLMALGNSYPVNRPERVGERLRWFQAAGAAHPENVAPRNNLGTALYDRGELDAAFTAFQEAIRLDPTLAIAHFNLGIILRDKRDWDGAVRWFQKAIDLKPSYAPAHCEIGFVRAKTGNQAGARASLVDAIAIEPKDADTQFRAAVVLGELGDRDGAIEAYRKAAEFEPKNFHYQYDLGCCLLERGDPQRGDLDAAIVAFRKAIPLEPKDASPLNNLGLALLKKGDPGGAIDSFKKAIEVDEKLEKPHYNLADVLLSRGNPDGAIAAYEKAIRVLRDPADAHLLLGAILCDVKKDYNGAITHFKEAVRLAPKNHIAHYNLGNALLGKGERPEAIKAYRKATELERDYVNAHFNLGETLLGTGNPDGAAASFRDVIRLAPRDAEAHSKLAWVLATGLEGKRHGKEAVELAATACTLTDWKDADAINTLAAAHAAAGDFDQAVKYQKKALDDPAFVKADAKGGRERLDLYERKKPYRDPAFAPREPGPPRVVKP